MALEGGYNLDSISASVEACVQVLLEEIPLVKPRGNNPLESTWRVIRQVRRELSSYWPTLGVTDEEFIDESRQFDNIDDVLRPLEGLQLVGAIKDTEVDSALCSWRSEFSKVNVWYATYGSNMNASRLRCYIEGGQMIGMKRSSVGSRDKSMPKDIMWKTFPHRLFFARERTATWGLGGVAFLHPSANAEDKAIMCLYKITLEQFNDVLLQENIASFDSPLIDLAALQTLQTEKQITVESLKSGWYRNVVYLGEEQDLPVLTMTCTLSDIDSFICGRVPVNPPSKDYSDTLIQGLVQGKQLSEEEALAYIQEASSKPLQGGC